MSLINTGGQGRVSPRAVQVGCGGSLAGDLTSTGRTPATSGDILTTAAASGTEPTAMQELSDAGRRAVTLQ